MKTNRVAVAALIAAVTAPAAFAQEAVQWRGEDGGNGHWYQVVTTLLPWQQSRQLSEARGGHLVTVTSAAERDLVWSIASPVVSPQPFWTGGYQAPGSCEPGCGWRWVTNEPFTYTTWGPGEPNNNPVNGDEDAICVNSINVWNDLTSNASLALVIEWSADCNGDGIVDYGQCRDGSLSDYNGNNIPDCCEEGVPCEVGNYPVQWRVEDGGNGNWYLAKRWDAPKTWEDAQTSAKQTGGHLACLTSEAENNFVYYSSTLTQPGCGPGQEGWHIGGFQDLAAPDYSEPAGGWRWISGETWQYTAWLTDVPGGDRPNNFGPGGEQYLKMSELPYAPYWDDVGVGSGQTHMCGAIIEWSADCNGDGIVDYGQILLGELADANANGVPDTCECDADINDDDVVNGADISVLLGYWGQSGKNVVGDITGDGIVNGADLAQLLGSWGECP